MNPRTHTDEILSDLAHAAMFVQSEPISRTARSFNPETRIISTAVGESKMLRPQTARVMAELIKRRGAVATKRQLFDAVWPDVHVTDDSLTQCIAEIRQALGDRSRSVVVTVPKSGYVLREPINMPPSPDKAHAFATSAKPETAAPCASGGALRPTIAVAPFASDGCCAQSTRLANAMLADVIHLLSKSSELKVISRLSSLSAFCHPKKDERIVALNANFILSGSLSQFDDVVAIALELVNAKTGVVIWSDRFEEAFRTLSTSLEAAQYIAAQVTRSVIGNEISTVLAKSVFDLENHSILLAAIGLMHRSTERDFFKARALLQDLSERVAHDSRPLAWLGVWHRYCIMQGWSDTPENDLRYASEYSDQALEKDPDSSRALVSQALVGTIRNGPTIEALANYDRAIELNPNDAEALLLRGSHLAFVGERSVCRRHLDCAMSLVPFHPHRFNFLIYAASGFLALEEYRKVLDLSTEAVRLNPRHMPSYRTKIVAEHRLGLLKESRDSACMMMRRDPSFRINSWKMTSPAMKFPVGQILVESLEKAGVPLT